MNRGFAICMSQKPRPRRRLSNTPKFVEETSYFKMLRETKEKAAKQKADQLKEAEKLVSKESPTSRRRGKMLQRTAENIEKEALEEFQSTFNAHLTQQAEVGCFGYAASLDQVNLSSSLKS
ncbi:uncharacterized protein LOC141897231 isoform X1 [Acropora palmata]|uniref:uncharacterized protein LOC141897231 isoform X1 n=1 Tax=Acropora palmata TaxID=6131 RepID=UPI003DA0236D